MKHTFQEIILKLQTFWAERGAVLWQPYYTQVGAGTMNPATFLRVLGPEPWNVAYVEPSVRPDDWRYGENSNRRSLTRVSPFGDDTTKLRRAQPSGSTDQIGS